MSASNYLENKLLDHSLGVASFTMPSNVYLALYTSDPGEANSGTEVSGNGYARQSCAFGAASGGASANSAQKTFTASGGNWGTITHWGLFDALTSGNLLHYGSLTAPRAINDGDSLIWNPGDLTISAD